MKTMTCKELGGACDEKFTANSFDEIGRLSKEHTKQMFDQRDLPHLEAIKQMNELMKDKTAFIQWLHLKKEAFDKLPNN